MEKGLLAGDSMNDTDIRILECLRSNARMNASAIGEKVNMSVSAVIERIRKMEAAGVIAGYTITLDNERIGKGTSAFIQVRLDHPKFNESFIEQVEQNASITQCYYIAGDFDFILKVVAGSTQELTQLLDEVKRIHGVSLTRTLLVLATYKDQNVVLPAATR